MGVLSLPEGQTFWGAYLLSPYFLLTFCAHVVALIAMAACRVPLQWYWLLMYSWLTIPFSPPVLDPVRFFRGGLDDSSKSAASFSMLACSSFVAWVFAKSIYNASALGAEYGIVGGLAYMSYYTSFPAVGICVYLMRTRFGYRSLAEAINERYGNAAAVAFGLVVLYRLFQEVWSNSLVVGSFFGTVHSGTWWGAVIASTAIPAAYSITGGMRSSLLTDIYQGVWKVAFLVAILVVVGIDATAIGAPAWGAFNPAGTCGLPSSLPPPSNASQCTALSGSPPSDPAKDTSVFTPASCGYSTISNAATCTSVGGVWTPSSCAITTQPSCTYAGGDWFSQTMYSLQGGLDLLTVGFLQGCLSYPFFDPVLTDRAFLAQPRTMLLAFLSGGALAAVFILLFSFLGIYGAMQAILDPGPVPSDIFAGVKAGDAASIAAFLGTAWYSVINMVFIVSSCAVVDSTFASTAKLFGPEFTGVLTRGSPQPPGAATRWHMWAGRGAIVFLAIVGTLPLMQQPTALSATTVSGTVVMGLGPPVWALTFIKGYRPLTFHLPFWAGIALGVVYQLATDPYYKQFFNVTSWAIGTGANNLLLGFNVVGVVVCWSLAALTLAENPWGQELDTKGGKGDGDNMFGAVRVAAAWLAVYMQRAWRRTRKQQETEGSGAGVQATLHGMEEAREGAIEEGQRVGGRSASAAAKGQQPGPNNGDGEGGPGRSDACGGDSAHTTPALLAAAGLSAASGAAGAGAGSSAGMGAAARV